MREAQAGCRLAQTRSRISVLGAVAADVHGVREVCRQEMIEFPGQHHRWPCGPAAVQCRASGGCRGVSVPEPSLGECQDEEGPCIFGWLITRYSPIYGADDAPGRLGGVPYFLTSSSEVAV